MKVSDNCCKIGVGSNDTFDLVFFNKDRKKEEEAWLNQSTFKIII